MNNQLISYFSQERTVLPQSNSKFYKYKPKDQVVIDATPTQRKHLGFKWSLNRGNLKKLKKTV